MRESKARWVSWIALGPVFLVLFLAFVAVGGAIVWQLWNWLLPGLFGWPSITFWQALGLLALCRILFGGFGGGRGRSRVRRRIGRRVRRRMRQRMWERWEGMTEEERERFRRGMHREAGAPPAATGDGGD